MEVIGPADQLVHEAIPELYGEGDPADPVRAALEVLSA
jgi:hypothetical protein